MPDAGFEFAENTPFGADQSARHFREILQALARPAQPRKLAVVGAAQNGLSGAATAVLTLLSDADATWWLASDRRSVETSDHLAFVTGAPMATDPASAAFLCGGWTALREEALAAASIGDADYPDRGATLVIEVDGFEPGSGVTLEGPGLASPTRLAVNGLDESFWAFFAENRLRFPLGLDVILCAGDSVVGLPRSLSVTGAA